MMKNEVSKNPLDQSDPLAESLGFAGFDAIDLLRFVESEMGDEEQIAFIEQVRSGDADAARRLARMKHDHDAMQRVPESVPGRDLLASVRSRIARGELIEDQLFADPGLEPTDLMSKSIEDLARRRRRDRRRPFEWAAAGITVAMLAGILATRLIDGDPSDGVTTLAAEKDGLKIDAYQGPPAENSVVDNRRSTNTARLDRRPALGSNVADADRTSTPQIDREPSSVLASFGLAVSGDGGEAFEVGLASLVLDANAVLIRNLTLAESMAASTGQFKAGLEQYSGQSSARPQGGTLQPPPIVGMSDDVPDSMIRIDLAERGFQYAIVVARSEVEGILARLSGMAVGDEAGEGARLIPSLTRQPETAFRQDAWSSWSQQAKARPNSSSPSAMLIVPIAIVPND